MFEVLKGCLLLSSLFLFVLFPNKSHVKVFVAKSVESVVFVSIFSTTLAKKFLVHKILDE